MIELDDIGAAAFVVARQDDGSLVYEQFNQAAECMTGLSRADTVGRTLGSIFPPDVAAMLTANYEACLESRKVMDFQRTVPVPLGSVTTRTTLTPLSGAEEAPARRLLGVSVDITPQHRLQEQLKTANARLGIAMDALGGAHWYYDAQERRFELSAAFERILGPNSARDMSLDEWLGHVHPEDREDTCFADILAGRAEQGTAEFRVVADNGDTRWLRCRRRAVSDKNELSGIAGVVVDVTQEKRREATLSLQAASDPLTGLPNRRRFEEVFAAEREAAARRHGALSLLMVDVDNFKAYTDTYGHIAGDGVLTRVARCVAASVEAEGGIVARYGGEEFIALLPGRDTAAAAAITDNLLSAVRALAEPHRGSPSGVVTVSVGVSGLSHATRMSGADMIALADAALYRAKNDGRDCYRVLVAPHLRAVEGTSSAA